MAATALSPPVCTMAKVLDRELFKVTKHISALRVHAAQANTLMREMEDELLNAPRLRNIVNDSSDKAKRLVLLKTKLQSMRELSSKAQQLLADRVPDSELVEYTLSVDYNYWTADEVLRSVIPSNLEIITAFETVGEVAHMNLREHMLPFKSIVGQVILDKNPRLKTVVNKTSNIKTKFRTFPLEILASSEPSHTPQHLPTHVSENDTQFHFDFAHVYWNSRLHPEHARLVGQFKPGQLVADAMCGVGPFAVPAGKHRGAVVWANDLNPDSYKWLQVNIDKNKSHLVRAFNEDGRVFIRESAARLNQADNWSDIQKRWDDELRQRQAKLKAKERRGKKAEQEKQDVATFEEVNIRWQAASVRHFDHYVMNLPASALSFLDAFHGLYSTLAAHRQLLSTPQHLPLIHVHCFSRSATPEQDVVDRINTLLGTQLQLAQLSPPSGQKAAPLDLNSDVPCGHVYVHRVRNVAPRKEMLCASFRLPAEVAFAETVLGPNTEGEDAAADDDDDDDDEEEQVQAEEPAAKKVKV
ncbi:tRNA(m(1)G37)methyltransferase [Sorochytrium milnesiophthora]